MLMSTWFLLPSSLVAIFFAFGKWNFLMPLPTDADEFVCSSSYCCPGGTLCAVSEKFVESSKVYFVFQLLLLLSVNEKCCACDYAVKTFAAPPFCIAKRGYPNWAARWATLRDTARRKFLDWRHDCMQKRVYKTKVMQQAAFFRCIFWENWLTLKFLKYVQTLLQQMLFIFDILQGIENLSFVTL